MRSQKVLFLCSGNTCRSPVAEALARARWRSRGLIFVSAGTSAWPGQSASAGARAAAAEMGATLYGHRSQPLTRKLLADVDWVIGMTRSHVALFKQRCGEFSGRIGLLGAPGVDLTAAAHTPAAEEVADPFGGDCAKYRAMAEQIDRLLAAWQPVFRDERPASGEK